MPEQDNSPELEPSAEPAALSPIFSYRIIGYQSPDGRRYMPQRGVQLGVLGVQARIHWRDAVPFPSPTLPLARSWVDSLRAFDTRDREQYEPNATVEWFST